MVKDKKPLFPPMTLTPEEAARELRISKSKLYELVNAGDLTPVKLGPQITRFRRTDLEAYLARKIAEQSAEHGAA